MRGRVCSFCLGVREESGVRGGVRRFLRGLLGVVSSALVFFAIQQRANYLVGQKEGGMLDGEGSGVDGCGEYTVKVRGLKADGNSNSIAKPLEGETREGLGRETKPEDVDMGVAVSERQREADRMRMD